MLKTTAKQKGVTFLLAVQRDLYFPVETAVWLRDADHCTSDGFIEVDLSKCWVLLPPLLFSQLLDFMLG